MPSRNRLWSSPGLWLVLVAATACIEAQEEKRATEPPPIVGTGTRTNGAQARAAGSGSTPKGGVAGAGSSAVRTQPTTPLAADSGRPAAAQADLDAGPEPEMAGSGSAGAGGRAGSSGSVAAGSGGRGGAGGSSGAGARGGQGGSAGGMPSEACMNQLCFTLVDCWLLSVEDCGYVACDNFVCR